MSSLGLAPDNYDYPLFHHPPGFVVVAVAFGRMDLPWPAVPVLLSLLTTLATVALARRLALPSSSQLWAGVMHLCCPLSWWASQKFWLDNALALAVCLCFVAVAPACTARTSVTIATTTFSQHTNLTTNKKDDVITTPATSVFTTTTATHCYHVLPPGGCRCAIAAAGVGLAAAMWCKVTAACAVPALALAAILAAAQTPVGKEGGATVVGTTLTAIQFLAIGAGVAAALYLPWVRWYHDTTGRWIPSAMPSTRMLTNAPFVANALAQQSSFYFVRLLRMAPVYALAVLPTLAGIRGLVWSKAGPIRGAHMLTTDLGARNDRNRRLILVAWAAGFLVGMSLIGAVAKVGKLHAARTAHVSLAHRGP